MDPRAQRALLGLFLLNGLMASNWLARIPAVRDCLGLTPAELGLLLPIGAVGSVVAVSVAGLVVARIGGRTTLLISTSAHAAAFTMLGLGPALGEVKLLAAGLFVNGMAFAIGNLPINVESAGMERRAGRTMLPHFHAAFSIGCVLGSLAGAACAYLGVSVLVQFSTAAVVVVVWRLPVIDRVIHDTRRHGVLGVPAPEPRPVPSAGTRAPAPATPAEPRPRVGIAATLGAWREPRTLILGFIVLSAAISEGAANEWLSLAVVDGFTTPDAVGAAVFGSFVGAMTVMRASGSRIIDRFGRVVVVRASAVAGVVGLMSFVLAPALPLAVAGAVVWGAGAALVVPLAIAAASDDPVKAAGRVAVVCGFAPLASLTASPLLGAVADRVGVRHALLAVLVVILAVGILGSHVAPSGPRKATRPAADPAADSTVDTPPVAAAAVSKAIVNTDAVAILADPAGDTTIGSVPVNTLAARWQRFRRQAAQGSASDRRPGTRTLTRRRKTREVTHV